MRVIAITGGKGGVGKTTIAVNTAIAFAKNGKRVLLFDADLSLANVDVVLGLHPTKTIHDFLSGECELNEICMTGPLGIKIIPASSGIQQMAELKPLQSAELIRSFSSLSTTIDIMVVDLASGISNQVIDFTHASQDIIVVICNDPSSFMDSYAVIKILYQKYNRTRFGIVVNKVKSLQEGYDIFSRFQQATAKFINVNMNFLAYIPDDEYISLAARERKSIVEKYPLCAASKAFNSLCSSVENWHDDENVIGGIHFFFERLVQASLQGV